VRQALQRAIDLRGGHQLGFLDDAHPGEHPSIGERRRGTRLQHAQRTELGLPQGLSGLDAGFSRQI
jgi:hypothetical protein